MPFLSIDGELTIDGREGALTELTLDLRRLRFLNARLMRLVVVTEPDVSVLLDESVSELSDELDELWRISARIPGWDSSSMILCGVLS